MIKGHVEIDLHNHNSGFTERIEQDNLVTDAPAQFIDFVVGRAVNTGGVINKVMPLHSTTLGGLMIFEDTLTESVSNVRYPYDNTLIGYAGQSMNSDDEQRGSINTTESGPVTNGYMTVWDFSTSQANGQISSMARTHAMVENRVPIMADIAVSDGVDTLSTNNDNWYAIKFENNYIYLPHLTNKTLRRIYYPVRNYLLSDPYSTNSATVEIVAENVFNESSNIWANGYDGKVYSLVTNSRNNNVRQVEIAATYLSTNVYYGKYIVRFKDYTNSNVGPNFTGGANSSRCTISNGILYFVDGHVGSASNPGESEYDGKKIVSVYACDLKENPITTGTTKTIPAEGSLDPICVIVLDEDEDGYYYSPGDFTTLASCAYNESAIVRCCYKSRTVGGTFNKYILVKPNGEYKVYSKKFSDYAANVPYVHNSNGIPAFYGTTARLIGIYANYLGTICNIEQPFEKTNTTSMKVKYTLTNV